MECGVLSLISTGQYPRNSWSVWQRNVTHHCRINWQDQAGRKECKVRTCLHVLNITPISYPRFCLEDTQAASTSLHQNLMTLARKDPKTSGILLLMEDNTSSSSRKSKAVAAARAIPLFNSSKVLIANSWKMLLRWRSIGMGLARRGRLIVAAPSPSVNTVLYPRT